MSSTCIIICEVPTHHWTPEN